MRINKLILYAFFSLSAICCKENPVGVNYYESIFGTWKRVDTSSGTPDYRQGSSGITVLKLYFDSTYTAEYDSIKTNFGNFTVIKELIPFFSVDSINVLQLKDRDNILNDVTFGIISLSRDSLVLHRYATDSINEVFIRIYLNN